MRTALLSLALLLGASAAFAGDFSANDLAIHPSCVVYASDTGPRAQIDGAVVEDNRPVAGQLQQFVVDGRRYEATSGLDGIYTTDVPVFSAHPTIRETRTFNADGRYFPGQLGHARCITPNVNVGPLQSAPAPSDHQETP